MAAGDFSQSQRRTAERKKKRSHIGVRMFHRAHEWVFSPTQTTFGVTHSGTRVEERLYRTHQKVRDVICWWWIVWMELVVGMCVLCVLELTAAASWREV